MGFTIFGTFASQDAWRLSHHAPCRFRLPTSTFMLLRFPYEHAVLVPVRAGVLSGHPSANLPHSHGALVAGPWQGSWQFRSPSSMGGSRFESAPADSRRISAGFILRRHRTGFVGPAPFRPHAFACAGRGVDALFCGGRLGSGPVSLYEVGKLAVRHGCRGGVIARRARRTCAACSWKVPR